MPNIRDLTDDQLEEIADHNASTFYGLKKDLVDTRINSWSMDDFARLLDEPLEDVAGVEQYYSDPTASQLERYATGVGAYVIIGVARRPDDGLTGSDPSGDVGDYNEKSFRGMMDALIEAREASYTMPELADVLRRPVQELEDLESEDSDPTMSQVQEYALAVGMVVDARVVPYEDGVDDE